MKENNSFLIRFTNFFVRNEAWIFFVLVLLNTIPLIITKFFVTIDGPAHLYSASIINNLLFSHDKAIQDSFAFNTEPVPNWTAHLLLAIFKLIGPSWFAEKAFLLLYVIGLPYSFRFMLRGAGIKTPYAALLILPFTYTFLLLMGFFNFSIAFLPLFILLGIYFKTDPDKLLKKALPLFSWSLILYFSHIYVFAVGLFVIAFHSFMLILNKKENRLKFTLKYGGLLLVIMLPVLALFFSFVLRHPSLNLPGELNLQDRLNMIRQMQCFALYGIAGCMPYTAITGCGLLLLLLAGLAIRFKNMFQAEKKFFQTGDSFLLAGIVLFVLFFKLPDNAGGGMNCIRLLHLFTFCICAWAAFNRIPPFVKIPVTLLILAMQICLFTIFIPSNKPFASEAEEWAEAGAIPEKNTITIPVFFNQNWLNGHNADYFGSVNSRMITDNYEVSLNWFPIMRNKSVLVKLQGQADYSHWGDFRSSEWDTTTIVKTADYVVVWQEPQNHSDSVAFRPVDSLLKLNYAINFRSKNIRLFKRNK